MKKINNFVKIGVGIVFLFMVMAYSSNAIKFDVLLNWVLRPDGASVDANNDGIIDADFIFKATSWNSSGSNVYVNDSTANVGIGTDTPGTKLDVRGNISSSGNISITVNNKFCMNGTSCTRYIYFNGSDVVMRDYD